MKLLRLLSLPILILFSSCSDFDKEAKPVFTKTIKLYETSLLKAQTAQSVWHSAIFDKRYALTNSNVFDEYYVSDFNIAMQRMEKEPLIIATNKRIKSLGDSISNEISQISDRNHESYDKLVSLYSLVTELGKIAISPNGNLRSYTDDIKSKESQINMLITELKTRNPGFTKE